MAKKRAYPLVPRDLSWLRFNARVLQEAENPRVPLYERLQYLAIFSANLDEFFAVRVAALRSVLRLDAPQKGLREDPQAVLEAVQAEVLAQQERFGAVLRDAVLPALAEVGVPLVRETDLTDFERARVRTRFRSEIAPHVQTFVLGDDEVFLRHQALYLACELFPRSPDAPLPEVGVQPRFGIVEIPTDAAGRFVALDEGGTQRVLFLDDVLRLHLADLFPDYTPGEAYSIKVSRDAELYLGECRDDLLREEFARRFRRQLRRSLDARGAGTPTRFLYDPETPARLLRVLRKAFGLKREDLFVGGRYHHLRDLRDYPRPAAHADLAFAPQPPHPHPAFEGAASTFDVLDSQDQLLMLPYQSFDAVVDFLDEAAADPAVERIAATLYRVAEDSRVAEALISAARAGKQVQAVVELKARFDEANNLDIAERMEAAGVRVYYTACSLKVHAKLVLVQKRDASDLPRRYAYLATGNLNEHTARVYTDYGLFTAHEGLTADVARVFAELCDEVEAPLYDHLLVAPRHLRKAIYRLIDAETERARRGEAAWLFFKMNSLEDRKTIKRLYRASRAGVQIRLLVRGICRLVPGVKGHSETIEVRSIVGRYLEHGRAYVFSNGGAPLAYLGSADLMRRNLSRRVEVLFPVLDAGLRKEVMDTLATQWRDTAQARLLDDEGTNRFVTPPPDEPPFSSQDALYARYGPPPADDGDTPFGHALVPALLPAREVEAPPPHPRPAVPPTPASVTGRMRRWLEHRPVRSSILVAAGLLLLVPFSFLCNRDAPPAAPRSAMVGAARGSFQPRQPDTLLVLDAALTEISGQTLLSDTLMAAIQDEDGAVFILDPRTGHVLHTHTFGDTGDYEDVALTPEGLYVLRSDGDLYHIPDWQSPASEAVKIETILKGACDAEGLAYDARENRLLIACKERPGTGDDGERAIYAFRLATHTVGVEPAYRIDVARVATMLRHADPDDASTRLASALDLNTFKPSALAFHPHNGQLYVIASRPPSIAVLARDGALLGAELLPEGYLPQPEGIAFRTDGAMYLSSEAAPRGGGRLALFRYLQH